MTDNEIVKALKCCGDGKICDLCPLYAECMKGDDLFKITIDLINRLQAENEFLKEYNKNLQTANTTLSNEILDTKTEAYKEFAEKVKKHQRELFNYSYSENGFAKVIDSILKVMVGEQ